MTLAPHPAVSRSLPARERGLTSTVNIIHLNRKMNDFAKGSLQFRNTKNGTRFVSTDMADVTVIESYFDEEKLKYFHLPPEDGKTNQSCSTPPLKAHS